MGLAVAGALADKGCTVILTWRHSRASAERSVAALNARGGGAFALRCDVTRPSAIRRAVRQVARRFGRLDVLVNLAAIYERSPLMGGDAGRVLEEHLFANVKSAFALSIAAAPLMKRSGQGRIIHFSDWTSASGRPRYKDYSGYYVSKAAVKGIVETLALELAPLILVNAVAPGPILPPKGLSGKEDRAVRHATPLGRWGGPQEIAKAVVFLAETDFVTGETIRVDGGRHLL